jgi:hypothetical protein
MNLNINTGSNQNLKSKGKIKVILAVIGLLATIGPTLLATIDKWWPLLTGPQNLSITEHEVEQMIGNWRDAWERADWQTYSKFYDANFSGHNFSQASGHRMMTRDEWVEDKAQKFSRGQIIYIRLGPKTINSKGDTATVEFTQLYKSSNYEDYGLKTLRLKKQSNGTIYILGEDFVPQ